MQFHCHVYGKGSTMNLSMDEKFCVKFFGKFPYKTWVFGRRGPAKVRESFRNVFGDKTIKRSVLLRKGSWFIVF